MTTASPPLRVLVVEDSITVRKAIVGVLRDDPGFEVVGEAATGEEGVALCRRLKPDVITVDMVLPRMSGVDVTAEVMGWQPTPILVVSASMNRGESFRTFEALSAGAMDVLDKPGADRSMREWGVELRQRLRLISRVAPVTHLRSRAHRADLPPAGGAAPEVTGSRRPSAPAPRAAPGVAMEPASGPPIEVIAVGASTGGPTALQKVLQGLPRAGSPPVLLVLHITELFAAPLAAWLQETTGWPVRVAAGGERLDALAGQARLAPSSSHLGVREGRLRLIDGPERHSCKPSVDVLFESVAATHGGRALGCLLTGMGRDGAAGLRAMRDAGAFTIAQDEATSVIYGMPAAAVELGGACEQLPLDAIGPRLGAIHAARRAHSEGAPR